VQLEAACVQSRLLRGGERADRPRFWLRRESFRDGVLWRDGRFLGWFVCGVSTPLPSPHFKDQKWGEIFAYDRINLVHEHSSPIRVFRMGEAGRGSFFLHDLYLCLGQDGQAQGLPLRADADRPYPGEAKRKEKIASLRSATRIGDMSRRCS
jgi:hypothetical protein